MQLKVFNPCIRTRNNVWKSAPQKGSTIFSHVCIVEGVLSKLNPQVENSVPKSYKITHSHKQRTVLEQQNKKKPFSKKNKGEHIRNGTLHIYCKLRQITHFLNYKRSIQKKRQKFKINRVRKGEIRKKNHWLIISKLYFYTKKVKAKKSEKGKTNQKQHIKTRKMK